MNRALGLALLLWGCAVVLWGCAGDTAPTQAPLPVLEPMAADLALAECDAGDAAFARRLVPVMWGRRPASTAEVDALAQIAGQLGRDGLVRAMARSPEYVERWRLFLGDVLHVARANERSNPVCYGRPLLESADQKRLAALVRDHGPTGQAFDTAWTMYDLVSGALAVDDLSPVFRANLLVHLTHDFSTANLEAARGLRDTRVQDFMRGYLGRRADCLPCHNARQSVTDHADPALDRTWQPGGWLEEAVFGSPAGRPTAELRRFFRRKGVVAGFYFDEDQDDVSQAQLDNEVGAAVQPWGIHTACGAFRPPAQVPADEDPGTAWFITDAGQSASAWTLETLLSDGFAGLRGAAASLPDPAAADQAVDGGSAFVWLLALSLADRVWEESHGWPLTIGHGYPRLRAQRDVLRSLAERFVTADFSLVELLVAATAHPTFNLLAPDACLAGDTDGIVPPLFDPFGEDPGQQRPGDLTNTVATRVQRLPARTLVHAASFALGWAPPVEFFTEPNEEALLFQEQAGVFVKPPSSGFRGTSFQLSLAWEQRYGACRPPTDDTQCAYIPLLLASETSADPPDECPLCGPAADELCAWDERCCGVDWASICPQPCTELPGDDDTELLTWRLRPAPPRAPPEGDFVRRILAAAPPGATLGDAVLALKDRLLTEPGLSSDAEAAVLAELAGRSLDSPLTGAPADDDALRRVCGVLLSTPDFLLTGLEGGHPGYDATARPPLEVPGTDFTARCQALADALFAADAPHALTCTGAALTVSPR